MAAVLLIRFCNRVGVVRQKETAALKAASSSASKMFTRELSAIYTKSTLPCSPLCPDSNSDDGKPKRVLCIHEKSGSHGRTRIYMVAVEPLNGNVEYDEFDDSVMRESLAARIAHIEPVEILLPPLNVMACLA